MRRSTRPPTRLFAVALTALVLLHGGPAAGADASAHDLAFRRAEIRERSLGDLAQASELYLEAAREAPDTAQRARAELRAAGCLQRLGENARAAEIAARWAEHDDVPRETRQLARDLLAGAQSASPETPVAPPPAADPERVTELEGELDQVRLRLEQALDQNEGARQEMEALAAELGARVREIAKLRAQLPPAEPASAEEALALRRQELERKRREARALGVAWTRWAARLHQEGHFAEAREVLRDALASDPENAEAKALLTRVVAPLGDRERLHVRIREVLALAREVRGARMLAEVEYLAQQGRRLQESGDVEASVGPLERARALVASPLVEERAPARLRSEIEESLRRVEAAGIARRPEAPPEPEPLDASWTAALRDMLAASGREIEQGLDLRFHDLDPLLPATSVLLPPAPVTDPPAGWTLSTQGADPAGLIVAWLAGGEVAALATPRVSLELVGSTLVALADDETQQRLQSRISAAALAAAPAAEIEIAVLRAARGAWEARLRARGLADRETPGGARVCVIPPADLEELVGDAGDGAVATTARTTFRAAHLQPFRLLGGGPGHAVTIDVMAVSAGDPGAALQVETSWCPVGRTDAAPLTQTARVGAPLAAGGALALHGLTDPDHPSSDLVVVARLGTRAAPAERPAPPDVASADRPESRVTEHLLPRTVARVQELNAALLTLPEHPIPSRGDALLARLRRAAVGAVSLEVRGDRVLVVGPQAAQDGVRDLLDRLASVRSSQRFRVEAYVLSVDTEKAIVDVLPSLTKLGGKRIATATVDARAAAPLRRILASSARPVSLTEPVVATPPTVRTDAAHVVRTPYRRELDVTPGEALSWGRAETATVDLGFVLALRPFGRDARDRDELDVSLRLVRLAGSPARSRSTALGDIELVEPESDVIAADFPATLAAGDTLVIGSVPSPYAAADGTERMLLLVRPER